MTLKTVAIIQTLCIIVLVLLLIKTPPHQTNSQKQNVSLSSLNETCPYQLNSDFPAIYRTTVSSDQVKVTYPPTLISPAPTTMIVDTPFDPKQPTDVWQYWIKSLEYNPVASPWTEQHFDVDGDGIEERILTANVAMNHTPHVLEIVKNNRVIFEARGANISADPVSDHKGFFLSETKDWNNGSYRKTRYVYDSGKFTPIWLQNSCRVI